MPYLCCDAREDIDFFFSGVVKTEEELESAAKRMNLHIFKDGDPSNGIECQNCHDYLMKKRKMAGL